MFLMIRSFRRYVVPAVLSCFLLFLYLPVYATCPSQCNCLIKADGLRINCRFRSLKFVVSDIPEDAVEIDFGANKIANIERSSFPILNELRILFLDGCLLEELESWSFINVRNLEYLDLSYNSVRTIHKDAFRGLTKLRKLFLNSNKLSILIDDSFAGLNLHDLELDSNEIHSILPNAFRDLAVKHLSLNRNGITVLSRDIVSSISPNLTTLSIQRNEAPLTITADTFWNSSLVQLNLSESNLQSFDFLASASRLTVIDLSGNAMPRYTHGRKFYFRSELKHVYIAETNLTSSMFHELTSTQMSAINLDLSSNQIKTIGTDMFRRWSHLITLDLSHNQILTLPSNLDEQLPQLETLILRNGSLLQISSVHLSHMNRLWSLDLSGNKLQVFTADLQSIFERLHRLNIANNPFHCNCEMLWLRRLVSSATNFVDTDAYSCVTPRRTPFLSFPTTKFNCSAPVIVDISLGINVEEGSPVLLKCIAQGDPAPSVNWTSPLGEVFGIIPSSNRTDFRTFAMWTTPRIRRSQSGIYSCKAFNLAGSVESFTRVSVTSSTRHSSGSTTADRTAVHSTYSSFTHNTSSADTTISNFFLVNKSVEFSSFSTSLDTFAISAEYSTSGNASCCYTANNNNDLEGSAVVIVLPCVVIVVVIVIVVIVIIFYRSRYRKKYEVNHDEEFPLNQSNSTTSPNKSTLTEKSDSLVFLETKPKVNGHNSSTAA